MQLKFINPGVHHNSGKVAFNTVYAIENTNESYKNSIHNAACYNTPLFSDQKVSLSS